MHKRKIRRTLSALLLLTAIAVTQIPVSDVMAQAVASDFQIDKKNLIKYAGTTEQVVSIPDDVKSIAEDSFSGHNELIKVTIGEEVEKIGNAAFANCNSLRTVVIGDSVKEIESGAFSNCPNLVSVTLGAGVAKLGSGVFAGCDNLKDITIDKGNTHLVYRKGIIYDKDEKVIYQLLPGYQAEYYEVPNTVSQIQAYAFWGNSYLKDVRLGSKLSEISAYSFSNCVNLTQVTIPHSVRSIGPKAFEDCVNLKKINIPESVTYIHETAFDGCPKVEFSTVEGTYGAQYAANRDVSQVAQTEQAEVDAATLIQPEELDGEVTPEPTPEPEGTPEAVTQLVTTEMLLGKSAIVSGRALVFIDNKETKVYSGDVNNGQVTDGQVTDSQTAGSSEDAGTKKVLENLLGGNDQKGFGFPKYTIVDDKIIADQAYYQNGELTSYEIPQGITQIGDFAFARTGLKEIQIPQGVERIGYGAFYHCDYLQNVNIPDTVTEIEPSAFDNTAWMKNWKNHVGQDYLIVGDGILLAYSGKDSIVNIPEGVKSIAAGVFQDHTGITAVNLPASLYVIGEDAFAECRNLKTVNGLDGVTEIRDRAFQNCALDKVYIPKSVEKIGLRAFDLSEGGTKSVTFAGNELPELSAEKTAMRLTNEEYRGLAFGSINKAFINDANMVLSNTVLDETLLGFRGSICLPDGTDVKENGTDEEPQDFGVAVRINSNSLKDDGIASATIPGGNGSYILKITDSDQAASEIKKAYGSIYGNREPSGLLAYDISLYEQNGNSRITKLGKQYITVLIPKPEGMGTEDLHVVSIDANGQLEEVSHQVVQTEEQECIQFTTSHFSSYGIYQYSDGFGATATVKDGKVVFDSLSGMKDASPDTGDLIHPKWFLAVGLLFASIALFFYKNESLSWKRRNIFF